MNNFGSFIKEKRLEQYFTLRFFCKINDLDPSNWSKIERGKLRPPRNINTLSKIAFSLKLDKKEIEIMFELAAIDNIPEQLLSNSLIVNALPVLIKKISRQALYDLLEILKQNI